MIIKNELIIKDLYRYTGKPLNTKNFLRTFFFVPGFRFIFFLRKASACGNSSFKRRFFWLFMRRMQMKFGFQISDRTKIGEGFYIGHFGTIVMTHNAIIGSNCNVNHGVTIGGTSRGKLHGAPIIGNFVWMGTNSVIVGKIKIGNNVMIAPGAFVNFDVPSNSIVIGNPGKIILKQNATSGYIKRIL